jgi:cystathionine gamma-synthase
VSVPPLDRSTIWPYKDGEPGEFYYSRFGHPAGAEAERELGELEGGTALLFSSGSAATTSIVLALLEPGATIAVAEHCYYGTTVLFDELARWGLRHVEFDQTGPPPEGVDLVWLEAPSNPLLTMPAIESAASQPAKVVVDATAATPVYLRPLERGADLVLHSATKFLTGHHDVLLGAVVAKDHTDATRLREFRSRTGMTASPDAAWLLSRSLKTLELRMLRHTENATEIARRLERHDEVEIVRYPGFGGLLSFDVAGGAAAARAVEQRLRRIANATSLGGVTSTLEWRGRWEGHRVPPGLLRLSVGLEPVEDVWADLEQSLESG